MDTQTLLGSTLKPEERTALESLADSVEGFARHFNKSAYVIDRGNNDVWVRDWLFGVAWDIKSVARVGTPSYRL